MVTYPKKDLSNIQFRCASHYVLLCTISKHNKIKKLLTTIMSCNGVGVFSGWRNFRPICCAMVSRSHKFLRTVQKQPFIFFIINRKLLTRGAGDSLASKNFVVVTTLPANLTAWLALAVPL